MAVKKGLESYHVIPLGSCHWAVKKAGSNNRLTKVLPTQKQAISHGKKIAKSNKTELFIHKADGRIKSRESYL
ncbi:MAG: DUF2188 domain-containing protein [Parcubacteria group bacterium]|nr:DUF2188 domain-containing protein [Parcubacteria group bacterium]